MASLYFLLPLLYIICTIYFIKGVYIRVFTIFYFVVNFVYYLSVWIQGIPLEEGYTQVFLFSFLSLFAIHLSYFITPIKVSSRYNHSDDLSNSWFRSINSKIFVVCGLVLYIFALMIYVKNNGVAFGGGYEARLEQNSGGGLSIILMYAFVPSSIVFFLRKPTKLRFILATALAIFCGSVYYYVIGGSRNVMGAAVLAITYFAYEKKVLRINEIAILSACCCVALIVLGALRYGSSLDDVISMLLSGSSVMISFALDSFSPIYAIKDIIEYIDKTGNIQYFSTFFNEFAIIVPRFLWESKPINFLNNGYFYTTYILNMDTQLTISPTIVGSFIIMFGTTWFWLWGLITGSTLKIIDAVTKKTRMITIKITFITCIGYCFFWVRDGLEVFMYISFKFFLCVMIIKAISTIVGSLLKRPSNENFAHK
ncbi:WzyE family oligosaccharide polymerase [Enterobacter cloacae complex sp. IR5448]|uniref:WzyE family oligosaccharide polymerase n=1 Tax=Enterobacter cloacae complex sp. IR5448 TaxID=3412371 RepID=UPI003B9C1B1E